MQLDTVKALYETSVSMPWKYKLPQQQWKCNHASLLKAGLNIQHSHWQYLANLWQKLFGNFFRLFFLLSQLSTLTLYNTNNILLLNGKMVKTLKQHLAGRLDNYLCAVTSLSDAVFKDSIKYIVLWRSLTGRSWQSDNCPRYRSIASAPPTLFPSLITH